jgi:UDP-N-acetylglucosamine--N-acetylmuramyl-(pentapeptide) pyrophosphoryl-undecaprenol N-acetylglucosamine transferase
LGFYGASTAMSPWAPAKEDSVGKRPLKCIMVAGGGTGGHLFPGIAVAEELRRRHPGARIVFVGTARGIEVRAVPRYGFALELLPVRALRGGGLWGLVRGLGQLPWSIVRAFALVRRLRPDIAIGVGGYAAGPAMLAARLAGVRCIILEQNAVAGVTNRMLGRLAHRVVAALPSRSFAPSKVRVLGNPVRTDLLPVREAPYVPPAGERPLRLLVVGGSQGARALNATMLQLVPLLQQAPFKLAIVHQTGSADAQRLAAAYAAAGLADAVATPFIDRMADAYARADLVLCRAGASTLAELTVCGRPSILVPYPHAADDHQTANAQVLVDSQAATLLPESELTAETLLARLAAFAADPAALAQAAAQARALGRPEATDAIAQLIETEAASV